MGPRSTPIGAAETYAIDAQEPGTECTGDIPTDALALSLNITALNATQQSFLTVWAKGPLPLAASLNPTNDQPPIPNAVTTDLSATQTFNIYNDSGSVDVVVDVNGYYENHNHDDRYYTEAEVDAAVATRAAAADVYTKGEADANFAPAALAPAAFGVIGALGGGGIISGFNVESSTYNAGGGYYEISSADQEYDLESVTVVTVKESFVCDAAAVYTTTSGGNLRISFEDLGGATEQCTFSLITYQL